MDGPRCETCRFWDAGCSSSEHDVGERRSGHCRRHPPVLNLVLVQFEACGDTLGACEAAHAESAWVFPTVAPDDWCGEWRAKTAAADETPVDALGLTARAENALYCGGCNTAGDVCAKTAAELKRLRHFGDVCLADVRAALAARGLRLKGDVA